MPLPSLLTEDWSSRSEGSPDSRIFPKRTKVGTLRRQAGQGRLEARGVSPQRSPTSRSRRRRSPEVGVGAVGDIVDHMQVARLPAPPCGGSARTSHSRSSPPRPPARHCRHHRRASLPPPTASRCRRRRWRHHHRRRGRDRSATRVRTSSPLPPRWCRRHRRRSACRCPCRPAEFQRPAASVDGVAPVSALA